MKENTKGKVIIVKNQEKDFKPKAGYFIGLGLIKKVYREGIISAKEHDGMVKTFTEEYKKYAAENRKVI